MSYIGQAPVFGDARKYVATGDNTTTVFNIGWTIPSANVLDVYVGGLIQEPSVAYSVAGTNVTFTAAPPTGAKILVKGVVRSSYMTIPSDASVTAAKMAADSVATVNIIDGNVTTAKILDGNVTAAKLAGDVALITPFYVAAIAQQVYQLNGVF